MDVDKDSRVATRANALWQRSYLEGHKLALQRRNPRECAVAKVNACTTTAEQQSRNPRECAVAKVNACTTTAEQQSRNPRECAVAKNPEDMRYYNGEVATRANALWQRESECKPA